MGLAQFGQPLGAKDGWGGQRGQQGGRGPDISSLRRDACDIAVNPLQATPDGAALIL